MGMVEIAKALGMQQTTGISVQDALDELERTRQAQAKMNSHMNLGELIDALKAVDQSKTCLIEGSIDGNPNGVISYRGFYTDLCIEPDANRDVPVSEVLDYLEGAQYRRFEGYKGGDYYMDRRTLVWVAEYGCCDDDCVSGVIEEPYAVVLVTSKSREL